MQSEVFEKEKQRNLFEGSKNPTLIVKDILFVEA